MKHLFISAILFLMLPLGACSNPGDSITDEKKQQQPEEPVTPPMEENEYSLQASMQGNSKLLGADYKKIDQYMKEFGWDYTENPSYYSSDHQDGTHGEVIYDATLRQYVFKLSIHANAQVLDGDRGQLIDRQRNEMKSKLGTEGYKMNGNWDEWQQLEWKFKIPRGFQPSTSFCHLHQLKAIEGNNSSPIITITARSDKNGGNRRIQIIHTSDESGASPDQIIDNLPLEDFEDEWIQVQTEIHYTHNGYYSIILTRISDNKILAKRSFENIDLWRKDAISIRNKFGIYRSFGKTLIDSNDRPSNGIKDEYIFLGDFKIYEKNTNLNPQPHD